jgi:hypothetical protein
MQLAWDKTGQRFFEAGVDHGVLFPNGSTSGVAWSGLISIERTVSGGETESYYQDGIKYFDSVAGEDFQATLRAFTYPDEFGPCLGRRKMASGLTFTRQPRQTFGLAWRTKVGNDIDGVDHSSRIHLAYGLTAAPSSKSNATISDSPAASEFEWTLNAVPVLPGQGLGGSYGGDPNVDFLDWMWPPGFGMPGWPVGPDGNTPVPGWKATPYVVIDEKDVTPDVYTSITDRIFGTPETLPYMPSQLDLVNLLSGNLIPPAPLDPTYVPPPIDTLPDGVLDIIHGIGSGWTLTKNEFPDQVDQYGRATVRGNLVAVQYTRWDGSDDATRIIVGRITNGVVKWGSPLDITRMGYGCYWVYDDVFVDTDNQNLLSYKVNPTTLDVSAVSVSARPTDGDVRYRILLQPFVNELTHKVYMHTGDFYNGDTPAVSPKAWAWTVDPSGALSAPVNSWSGTPFYWSDSSMARLSPTEYIVAGSDFPDWMDTDLLKFDLSNGAISYFGTTPTGWTPSSNSSAIDAQDPKPGSPIVLERYPNNSTFHILTPNVEGVPEWPSATWGESDIIPGDAKWTTDKAKVVGWFYRNQNFTPRPRWDVFGTPEDVPIEFPDFTPARNLMVPVPKGWAWFIYDDQRPTTHNEFWVWTK